MPARDPLGPARLPPAALPPGFLERWPAADDDLLEGRGGLARLPIDHGVAPAPFRGGARAGARVARDFLALRLPRYGERNQPEAEAESGLSPYLHFGHVSAHQVFAQLAEQERWTSERLAPGAGGRREGWWGMSAPAEAFLDQLVTWRELGYNLCARRSDYDRFESLPEWALATLARHADDPRPRVYRHEQFEFARTHDELWNAAQNQLRAEGRMHNYLRMLWGKHILHWSPSPEAALEKMIELNNRSGPCSAPCAP